MKIIPQSDKNGAPEGPWISVLVPRGGLNFLFGSIRIPCGPKCPPCRFIDDFGTYFGGHLESKIYDIRCRFWMCFRDGGFRVVLAMFWETCWCQNDDQKAKGGFVEMLVLHKQYCCFRGLWGPFGVIK